MTLRTGGIRAGKLNRLCTIQKFGLNPNGTRGWQDFYTKVPCEVLPLNAGEAAHQLGPMNVQSTQLNMRYRPGITAQMRCILRNRIMEITSVINQDEEDVQLTLMCREAPPGT